MSVENFGGLEGSVRGVNESKYSETTNLKINELQNLLRMLRQDYANLFANIEQANISTAKDQNYISNLELHNSQLEAKKESLESQVSLLEKNSEINKEEISFLKAEISSLKSSLEVNINLIKDCQNSIQASWSNVALSKVKLAELSHKISQLEEILLEETKRPFSSTAKETIHQLKQEERLLAAPPKFMTKAIQSIQSKHQKVPADRIKELKDAISSLEQERDENTRKNTENKKLLTEKEKNLDFVELKQQKLEDQLNQLKKLEETSKRDQNLQEDKDIKMQIATINIEIQDINKERRELIQTMYGNGSLMERINSREEDILNLNTALDALKEELGEIQQGKLSNISKGDGVKGLSQNEILAILNRMSSKIPQDETTLTFMIKQQNQNQFVIKTMADIFVERSNLKGKGFDKILRLSAVCLAIKMQSDKSVWNIDLLKNLMDAPNVEKLSEFISKKDLNLIENIFLKSINFESNIDESLFHKRIESFISEIRNTPLFLRENNQFENIETLYKEYEQLITRRNSGENVEVEFQKCIDLLGQLKLNFDQYKIDVPKIPIIGKLNSFLTDESGKSILNREELKALDEGFFKELYRLESISSFGIQGENILVYSGDYALKADFVQFLKFIKDHSDIERYPHFHEIYQLIKSNFPELY